ncbi:MAG: CPBP family intramembrane glutamic endopeptidase [Gemmataceae bacterium]
MSTNILDAQPAYPDEPASPPPPPKPKGFPLHPNFWWGLLWSVGSLLLTQVPAAAVIIVILLGVTLLFPRLVPPEAMQDAAGMMQNPVILIAMGLGLVIAHLLLFALSLVCLRILAGRDWHRQVALRPPSAGHVLLTFAIVPAFMVLASASTYFFGELLGFPSLLKMVMGDLEGMTGPAMVIAAAIIGVLPAFSEEFWCRAFLGRGIVGKHGYVLGVLGTSFLFGAIHLDPVQGCMAMVLGVVMHYAYLTSRSLLVPMLLHFLNNTLAVALGGVETWQKVVPNKDLPAWPVLAAAGLLLLAVAYAFYQSRARLVTPEAAEPWRPPYPGVVCPPPGSATAVLSPGLSALSTILVLAGLAAFAAAAFAALRWLV